MGSRVLHPLAVGTRTQRGLEVRGITRRRDDRDPRLHTGLAQVAQGVDAVHVAETQVEPKEAGSQRKGQSTACRPEPASATTRLPMAG